MEIKPLSRDKLEEAAEVMCAAFLQESLTRYMFRLSDNKKSREIFTRLCHYRLYAFLSGGHSVWAALEQGRAVGVAILKLPGVKNGLWKQLKVFLSGLDKILPILTRVRFYRFFKVGFKIAPPSSVPSPHLTLEMLGVHPRHQGKGAGKLLLERVKQECREIEGVGIYLLTTEDKTCSIYRHLGYRVLARYSSDHLPFYHMFLSAGNAAL